MSMIKSVISLGLEELPFQAPFGHQSERGPKVCDKPEIKRKNKSNNRVPLYACITYMPAAICNGFGMMCGVSLIQFLPFFKLFKS